MFWINGEIFEQAIAPFDLTDRGLLLGDGVFDTALVLGGRIFHGAAHLSRLFDALAVLRVPADHDTIRRACAASSLRGGQAVLRTTVTRGPGPRGLRPQEPVRPTILASLAPLPANVFFAPLSLDIAAIRRNETSPTSRLKTINCLDAVLAVGEATAKGYDEALFLNCAGRVACAAAGNIFACFGKDIVTPPVSDGVLPGIIRAFVLAERGGREMSLDLKDLLAADAVFVTNSLRLIAPVTRIGERSLASKESDVIASLQRRLWQAVGADCSVDLPFPGAGLHRHGAG